MCGGCKRLPRHHISGVIYFFWSSNTFSVENRIPLKLVLGGMRDAFFITPHGKTKIKPSLQFSPINFGLVAFEESTCNIFFIYIECVVIMVEGF